MNNDSGQRSSLAGEEGTYYPVLLAYTWYQRVYFMKLPGVFNVFFVVNISTDGAVDEGSVNFETDAINRGDRWAVCLRELAIPGWLIESRLAWCHIPDGGVVPQTTNNCQLIRTYMGTAGTLVGSLSIAFVLIACMGNIFCMWADKYRCSHGTAPIFITHTHTNSEW